MECANSNTIMLESSVALECPCYVSLEPCKYQGVINYPSWHITEVNVEKHTFDDFTECGKAIYVLGSLDESVCTVNNIIAVYQMINALCCGIDITSRDISGQTVWIPLPSLRLNQQISHGLGNFCTACSR